MEAMYHHSAGKIMTIPRLSHFEIKIPEANRIEIQQMLNKLNSGDMTMNKFYKEATDLGAAITIGEAQIVADKNTNIDDLMKAFEKNEISIQKFREELQKRGGKIEFWDYATDKNPTADLEHAETGFKYNPFYHKKGKFFQGIVKPAILKAISFAHNGILKQYDQTSFDVKDPRLKEIKEIAMDYIGENFQHAHPYKSDFMTQIVDIVIFMMEEDDYYGARLLDLLNRLPRDIELTEHEKNNIETWH
jgi:hypothetical protein